MRIGFIGLGEAGALYAAAAAAHGDTVAGYDPAAPGTPEGVERTADLASAVSSADLVVVLTAASLSERIAADAAPHLRTGAVYADFTTASPATMEAVEQ